MKVCLYLLNIVFVITFLCRGSLNAQENLRSQLFDEVEKIMNQAKEKKAEIYSPKSFEKAMKYYYEADDYYKRGKKLEDIRENIKDAQAYFAKSLDACKLGEATFTSTMSARTDAVSAGAPKHSTELWNNAEEQFKSAGQELEEGNLGDAKEKAGKAESTYRSAELEAIKANFLNPARELIKQADELDVKDNAPKTLGKAQILSNRVENLLKQNRYDTDEARQLAQETKYEAAHAIFLHKTIEKMKKDNMRLEDILLTSEAQFQRVAGVLGLTGRFDNGLDGAATDMITAIKERDAKASKDADSLRRAEETIKQKDAEVDNLKQQVELMIKRLGTLSEAEKKLQDEGQELQRKLELKHQQEETVKRVASMFTEDEGSIFQEGDNIVLRLYGLTFPVGKSTIEQQYYSLLTKVQEAIRQFPKCKVTIEGHTDSQGSDDVNQTLSERRANSVAEYLMANMSVETPINYHGYGESRPIASNDTPEGRSKNRRIDIVIVPEWAGGGH